MTEPTNPGGGRHRAPQSRGGVLANPAVRGGLLIAIAIIIGIVLLQAIDDGSGPIGDGTTTTSAAVDATTTTAPSTSTTRAATSTTRKGGSSGTAKPPQQVTALVLNGSGVSGAATTLTNQLRSLGYQTLTPGDAAAQTGTTVYYASGFQRECTTIATVVSSTAVVKPMPSPVPTGAERASCLVIIGT
ncbi:MAG: LytR C-terminal domain-containing protein [Actinomycetes bacterium]